MEIKVIKKGTTLNNKETDSAVPNSKPKPDSNNLEKKVEHNISSWVSELREKKSFEFLRTRSFLFGLKGEF